MSSPLSDWLRIGTALAVALGAHAVVLANSPRWTSPLPKPTVEPTPEALEEDEVERLRRSMSVWLDGSEKVWTWGQATSVDGRVVHRGWAIANNALQTSASGDGDMLATDLGSQTNPQAMQVAVVWSKDHRPSADDRIVHVWALPPVSDALDANASSDASETNPAHTQAFNGETFTVPAEVPEGDGHVLLHAWVGSVDGDATLQTNQTIGDKRLMQGAWSVARRVHVTPPGQPDWAAAWVNPPASLLAGGQVDLTATWSNLAAAHAMGERAVGFALLPVGAAWQVGQPLPDGAIALSETTANLPWVTDPPVADAAPPSVETSMRVTVPKTARGLMDLVAWVAAHDVDANAQPAGFPVALSGGRDVANNVARVPVVVDVDEWPDLAAESLLAPSVWVVGQKQTVAFDVSNLGNGPTKTNDGQAYVNRLYLSKDGKLDEEDALLWEGVGPALVAGQGQAFPRVAVRLPDDAVRGSMHLILKADAKDQIDENGVEQNNIAVATIETMTAKEAADRLIELGDPKRPKKNTVAWISLRDFEQLVARRGDLEQPSAQTSADPTPNAPMWVASQAPGPSFVPAPAAAPEVAGDEGAGDGTREATDETAAEGLVAGAGNDAASLPPFHETTGENGDGVERPSDVAASEAMADATQGEVDETVDVDAASAADANNAATVVDAGGDSNADAANDASALTQTTATLDTPLTVVPGGREGQVGESDANEGDANRKVDPSQEANGDAAETPNDPTAVKNPSAAESNTEPTQNTGQVAEQTTAQHSVETPASSDAETGNRTHQPEAAPGGVDMPTSAPKADLESPPVVRVPGEVRLKPGSVLTGKGIRIRTAVPNISYVTYRLKTPERNPVVSVTFDQTGKVVDAQVLRSSGEAAYDGPVLNSLWRYVAEGPEVENADRLLQVRLRLLFVQEIDPYEPDQEQASDDD